MEIKFIWEEIYERKNCDNCPLKYKSHPLLFKPAKRVKVMVVTEGPNEEAEPEFITSIANHPTFTFLRTLFQGKFQPQGANANVYWAHLRKCFLRTRSGKRFIGDKDEDKALEICSKNYLVREIKALKPKFIVATGSKADKFFSKYDDRLKRKKLEDLVFKEGGVFNNVGIEEFTTKIIIVPHPSGRNTLWTKLPINAKKVLEKIQKEIIKNL